MSYDQKRHCAEKRSQGPVEDLEGYEDIHCHEDNEGNPKGSALISLKGNRGRGHKTFGTFLVRSLVMDLGQRNYAKA